MADTRIATVGIWDLRPADISEIRAGRELWGQTAEVAHVEPDAISKVA